MKQSIVAHAPGNQALLMKLKDELVALGCPEDANWNGWAAADTDVLFLHAGKRWGLGLFDHSCSPAPIKSLTPATYPYVRNAFLAFYDLPVVPIEEIELCEG